MAREQFPAFITKYALTKGILEKRVGDCFDISPNMVSFIGAEWSECYHGRDWHRSRADAIVRAEEMRKAKIESLKRQLTLLTALKFE